jgi:hypothetical protein
MERESRLRLAALLADYSDLAPGIDARGFESIRLGAGAPAAGRHQAFRFSHPWGFRVVHLRNMGGVSVINLYCPGTGVAIVPNGSIIRRTVQVAPIAALVSEVGDVPAPAVAGTYLPAGYDITLSGFGGGMWVPPNVTLELIAATAATGTDAILWITAPRP